MPILIRRGHRGQHVAEVQTKLNQAAGHGGYYPGPMAYSSSPPLVADGIYGKNTRLRVMEFQSRRSLKVDGIVGPNTWSALMQKPASFADESKAAKAEAEAAEAPKARKHLYVHAHDAPGQYRSGSHHDPSRCAHVVIPNNGVGQLNSLIKAEIEGENMLVEDLVLNSHGAGAGIVKYGGVKFQLGDKLSFFREIKQNLAGNGMVWIFACAFATPTAPESDSDAWIVNPSEIKRGLGTKQMQKIATHLNRPVRAGFGMQFGDMAGFTTPWAQVTPGGDVSLHTDGRELTWDEMVAKEKAEFKAGFILSLGRLLKDGNWTIPR